MKLKKGDKVIVIAGKYKGEKGPIMTVNKLTNRVVVEGVGKVTHFVKAKKGTTKGSIVEREATINASNVMILDAASGKGARIGKKLIGDKMVRINKKSGAEIK